MVQDNLLDTSNYPVGHELYCGKNANKIGMFKDESCGLADYQEWVFLRSKSYSLLAADDANVKKAKGVSGYTVREVLKHQDYKRVYESLDSNISIISGSGSGIDNSKVYAKQARIGSSNHQLYTMTSSKLALSAVDDKRYWVEQNKSLPYGHYKLLSSTHTS